MPENGRIDTTRIKGLSMIYKTIHILFFLTFATILSASLCTSQGWGAIVIADAPAITVNVKNEPLKAVFGEIFRTTGYQISIDEKWADYLVTAHIKDAPLDEGLRRVLGNLNHAIVTSDTEKRITIYIYERDFPARNKRKEDSNVRQVVDYRDLEVIPPDNIGGQGVTLRELDDILASENSIDPTNVEVIPPQIPGERGITQRELDDILARENSVDPLDLEVIPPQNPGEKGITQRELNAIIARDQNGGPIDIDVTTPPPIQ